MPRETHVVIVGGGIQAVALAARLDLSGGLDFIIVDPEPLLSQWFRGMRLQGLKRLRTPATAHLDPYERTDALLNHMRSDDWRDPKTLEAPAPVSAFNAHARSIVEGYGLADQHLRGWVTNIEPGADGYLVTVQTRTKIEHVSAKVVVVCAGLGNPMMPVCGPADPRVVHSDVVDYRSTRRRDHYCIVGGGLTAATLATKIAGQGAKVTLCARSPITVSQLEADPAWRPGEPLQKDFLKIKDWQERSRQLRNARVGRGITPDVWMDLTRRTRDGQVEVIEGMEVEYWECKKHIRIPGVHDPIDQLVFSTGYQINAAELGFLRPLRRQLAFTGGLPHVSNDFEALGAPNLFFMGRLGELGGGPLTRNIPGARYASKRVRDVIVDRH